MFTNDKKGRVIEINNYNGEGVFAGKATSTFDDNGNKTSSGFKADGSLSSKVAYNDKGVILSQTHYNQEGDITRTISYRYDEDRNLIEQTFLNGDGSILSKHSHVFEYDDNKNWVNQMNAELDDPKDILTREIVYYD
jgi:YD repeat-containing protein